MDALTLMLNELESSMLHTILVPSKRAQNSWDMIRVNDSIPPKWYRRFCAGHESKRKIRRGKFDTRIKRANTLRALRQLIDDKPAGKYGNELRHIAREIEASHAKHPVKTAPALAQTRA